MSNFDYITKKDMKEYNLNWPQILDHPYRILMIEGFASGKTNSLLSLINHQPDIDKIYLCAKDPYEEKYQFLISKRESTHSKPFNDPKAVIEYSNDMDDIYKNIEEYNLNKKRKILIVCDGMTADMLSSNKVNPVVTELFIRGRKLNIFLVFMKPSYFAVPKNIRLNSTHYFIMKIPNKRDIQQITFNHSSDIDLQDFLNLYTKCTAKPYSFLATDTTLSSDNPLRFREIHTGRI